MKYLMYLFLVVASLSSCTINRIAVYGNGNQIDAGCNVFTSSTTMSSDGVVIRVNGFNCDFVEFANSNCNKDILIAKGYRMSIDDSDETVIFTHPKYY
jgi:hypothetical protein